MQTIVLPELPDGYAEQGTLILHSMFHQLVDFYEGDAKKISWKSEPGHVKAWEEMTDLYNWWTKERPHRHSPIEDIEDVPQMIIKSIPGKEEAEFVGFDTNHPNYALWMEAAHQDHTLEQQWYAEDIKNMHRLIDVSSYMWL
jgi:hypothetical protein